MKTPATAAALAMWLDAQDGGMRLSYAWATMLDVIRASHRNPEMAERAVEVARLRWQHGLTYDAIGARLRPPVSIGRVRQMLARNGRVIRGGAVRCELAMELDDLFAPEREMRQAK